MYLKREVAIIQTVNRNSVIEIARGFTVNGDDWELPEIAPLVQLARGDQWLDRFGLLQHLCRKLVRQVEFADYDFYVHPKIIRITENFDHAAAWILRRGGPVSDFDVHDHVLEIVPGGPLGGLFAQNSMRATFFSIAVRIAALLFRTSSQFPFLSSQIGN